ncbi:hypothetical protein BC567DRAFT_59319 [Phyllosticta citribraziliensis]
MDDFEYRFKRSRLNAGGWSTQSPTEYQAKLAIEFTRGGGRGFLSFFSRMTLTDETPPAPWPFGAMWCLNPDHISNWWPSNWAIPTWEEIFHVLRHYLSGLLLDESVRVTRPSSKLRFKLLFSTIRDQSFEQHNIDGGQLVEQNKGTLSTVLSTSDGAYDFDATTRRFSKRNEPLDKRLEFSSRPMTAIFQNSYSTPRGVLFDFEDDIKTRIKSSDFCQFVLLSSSPSGVQNIMLVEQFGDGYERIAVGQLFQPIPVENCTKSLISLS